MTEPIRTLMVVGTSLVGSWPVAEHVFCDTHAFEVKQTPAVAGVLRSEIDYWSSVRAVLATTNCDSYVHEVIARYEGYSPSLLERTIP
jgi:hypothetical protein